MSAVGRCYHLQYITFPILESNAAVVYQPRFCAVRNYLSGSGGRRVLFTVQRLRDGENHVFEEYSSSPAVLNVLESMTRPQERDFVASGVGAFLAPCRDLQSFLIYISFSFTTRSSRTYIVLFV